MKKYYVERNGLINSSLSLSINELVSYFMKTYRYFLDKGYFECAIKGVWIEIPYHNDKKLIIPPSLAPDPDVFFATRLQDRQVWPIYEYAEYYSEEVLFTVIEILYDHIAIYDYREQKLIIDEPKSEFAEHINNILRMYEGGYYIEVTHGFVMKLPNETLKQQLCYKGEDIPNNVYEQLATASSMFYRFDSNLEVKKKAINILADILENEREELKNLLNEEYEIAKNEHDKLIFGVVNAYNIRHNRADQKGNYSKEIWYEWMMQYYTSVIIAFYKLKTQKEIDKLFS